MYVLYLHVSECVHIQYVSVCVLMCVHPCTCVLRSRSREPLLSPSCHKASSRTVLNNHQHTPLHTQPICAENIKRHSIIQKANSFVESIGPASWQNKSVSRWKQPERMVQGATGVRGQALLHALGRGCLRLLPAIGLHIPTFSSNLLIVFSR